MKKYMVVGERMIEFTWKDLSEKVIIKLSNEGKKGVDQEVEQGMGTKHIPSIGNHMCKDSERRPVRPEYQ